MSGVDIRNITFCKTSKIVNDYIEIYSSETECSCTHVTLPKGEIMPGDFATIDVIFDTNGKSFFQNRIIYIYTNTRKKKELLRFKVFVEPKPMEQEPVP